MQGHVDIVSLLVEKGAAVNTRDSTRQMALHLASERGDTETVAVLLQHAADARAMHMASLLWRWPA